MNDQRTGNDRRAHDRRRTIMLATWLGVVTLLVAIALISLQSQNRTLQAQVREFRTSRLQATQQRCDLDRILLGLLASAHVEQLAPPLSDNLADCRVLLLTYERGAQ